MEKLLANDFVSNFNGLTPNKKQFLAEMKANPATIESAANSEMKAIVFGDTAVVHGRNDREELRLAARTQVNMCATQTCTRNATGAGSA